MHLSLLSGRGLLLINGEFGERLVDQAMRVGLDFAILQAKPGHTFTQRAIQEAINKEKDVVWIWTVHCETSTGVLNDLQMLHRVCKQFSLKLCLDGISTIGSCTVDLQNVYLASAVSGKGMGSLPGLAMVFCGDKVVFGDHQLPKYFDLAYYEQKQGIPFTISSNAVDALIAAVEASHWSTRFGHVQQWSEELRTEIQEIGLTILADKCCRAPHITTIVLPPSISSFELGDLLEAEGILVSYRSEYLKKKNYLQICLMGECQKPPRTIIYFLRKAINQVKDTEQFS
ncbi:MAG: alanine--glyoxylate aminotransferase family protein [Candidatus Electrothrix sp. AR3]|nr:alanine--glyoxylate aminotransferase family protein [Candidatus Electrothrix sp. AR3]